MFDSDAITTVVDYNMFHTIQRGICVR